MKIEVSLEEMEQIEEIIIVGKDDFVQGGYVDKGVAWVEEPYCNCKSDWFSIGSTGDPVGKVYNVVAWTEKMHDDDIIVGSKCGTRY